MMKKTRIFYIGLLVFLVLAMTACGDKDKSEKEAQKQEGIEITKDEKVADDKIVAQVNEHEITGQYYNSFYIQTKMKLHQFGEDTDDKEVVKDQTLEELIAHELLRQEAESKGIKVSEEELDSEFEQLKIESGEQLTDYLKEFDLTEDAFKDQMEYSLVLNEYLTKELPVEEVPDEDAKELYKELTKDDKKEVPEFSEVKGVLKEQIAQQKQQEALQGKLASLKKDAKIEKKI